MHSQAARWIDFDEQGYAAFLRGLGISAGACERLSIWLVWSVREYEHCYGIYVPRDRAIYLLLSNVASMAGLNHTLLHETRHFQKHVYEGYCVARWERRLPWKERPSEVDAEAFAEEYADRVFLSGMISRSPLDDTWMGALRAGKQAMK